MLKIRKQRNCLLSKNQSGDGSKSGFEKLVDRVENKIYGLSKAGCTPAYIALSKNSVKHVIRCRKLQISKIVKKAAGRKHKLDPKCQH